MKFRILAALVLLLVVTAGVAFWVQPASVRIADPSKAVELTLQPKHQLRNVTELHVEGRGRIEGAAEITLLLNGQPHKTERVNGDVQFSWRVDWHATDAVVRYTPLTAKGGSMELRYHFYGS